MRKQGLVTTRPLPAKVKAAIRTASENVVKVPFALSVFLFLPDSEAASRSINRDSSSDTDRLKVFL